MTQRGGLTGIWEDLNNYLVVDVEVNQDEVPNTKLPAIIKFTVTNTGQANEVRPEIIFEQVQLIVSVPPDSWVEHAENLAGGQSFTYEYHCTYDAIMQVQWTIEGKVSPTALLHFRRKPSMINKNSQFPVKAYFDFLEQMDIHQWLNGTVKSLVTPGPDTTLGEMKEKADTLSRTISEIRNSAQRFKEFLGHVDIKKYRDDLLSHQKRVQDYLNVTDRNIGELMQIFRENRIEHFNKTRDKIVKELTTRIGDLEEATEALAVRLGMTTSDANNEAANQASLKVEPPPPISLREIDLHGNTVDEAMPIVEDFLRQCYRDNVRRVRIIHGKGIFVLQKSIREYLGTHKFAETESISPADKDHGGEGATEANLIDFSVDNLN